MSAERDIESAGPDSCTQIADHRARQLMLHAQEAVALRRMVRDGLHLQKLCDDLAVFAGRQDTGHEMMQLLHDARSSLRRSLGRAP